MLVKKFASRYFKYLLGLLVLLVFGRLLFAKIQIKTIPVKRISIQNRYIQKTVSASGEIKSHSEATLAFSSAGNILSANVAKGDSVRKGQLLATLDTTELSKDIQYYKDARDIILRQKDRFVTERESNIDALGGEDAYNIRLREYDEQISQAQANYDSKVASLMGSRIYAPFDGTVIEMSKKVGEVASAAGTVLKIANLSDLYFETTLDQEDFGLIKQNQTVTMTFDAFDDQKFEGVVTKLPNYADGGDTPSFVVEVGITDKEKGKILFGMTGDIKVNVAESEGDVPSLLYDEVYYDDDNKPYIWIVAGGLIKKLHVSLGLEGDLYTEIKSSVSQPIITELNPDTEIREGYKAALVSKE